jgi:hypothetical protein
LLADQPPAQDALPEPNRAAAAAGTGGKRVFFGQDTGAGLLLLVLAALCLWQSADLSAGTLRQFGPGMLPRSLAVLMGFLGGVLIVSSLLRRGEGIGRWPWRGPVGILGAALLFAFAIRPLGLVVAGPVVVLVSMSASAEKRWGQAVLFAVALTTFCVVLFKLLLQLPIPVAPWLIGY